MADPKHNGPYPRSRMERFMEKVLPEPMSGCWLWDASTRAGKWNYGQLWDRTRQKAISTHRIAYELFVGPIPRDRVVMHTCDVPICVNPKHLRLGTFQENITDMVNKGRQGDRRNWGERNGRAKLTRDIVLEIRQALSTGTVEQKALAVHYRVSPTAINRIAMGKTWRSA